ncbi:MAG: aldo/keto reductase [Magnetococcales bacterium]|nr:aldo/keto reductase [Magnetococcales bacterium]
MPAVDAASARDRFCLGTVKLGLPDYGFSSPSSAGAVDPLAFLQQVAQLGIRRLDTSPRYGNSESVLGSYLAQLPAGEPIPWISSKIDQLSPDNPDTPAIMLASVQQSLQRLQRSQLDLCYLHQNELAIISDRYVQAGIRQLQERQWIKAVGVSLYSHEECRYASACGVYDVIQIPVSVFDLGFYHHFVAANNSPVRFAARSLLLQGILANRQEISRRIRQGAEILAYLQQLDQLAARWQMSSTEMAIRFAFSLPHIDHLLIGSLSVANLRAMLGWIAHPLPDDCMEAIQLLASPAKIWSNPRNW